MKDNEGQIIYVGKATSLKNRLSSYFNRPDRLKTRLLVSHLDQIDFIITNDPNEALILESNLIKTHQPKYNLVLKDAKHYSYLAITDEEFPRLLVARKNSSGKFRIKAQKYFGPFTEGSKRAISSRYLRKLFKIRICRKLPKKECLQYHIGNCDAPCIGKISKEDYAKNVIGLTSILEGKKESIHLIDELQKRMKKASNELDFERAAQIHEQLQSLEIFFGRQIVEKVKKTDEDYIWFEKVNDKLLVQILKSRKGVIRNTQKQIIEINEQEEPEISFCMQYYSEFPDAVYSNINEEGMQKLNIVFNQEIFLKPKGEKIKILEIASKSANYGEYDESVIKLAEELKLEQKPNIIETFDISTLFGENSVGSMVRFVNGKAQKSGYRKFAIKTVEGQNDFAMMKEVVYRRYSRLVKEGGELPDLIVIDGGLGQLHSAIEALEMAGVIIPIIGLAKKEEEIYIPNRMEPLRLSRTNPALKLLQKGRDEAHRFGVNYQRKRRKKSAGL